VFVAARGYWWTDEYMLKPLGVLECPSVVVTTSGAGEENMMVEEKEEKNAEGEWVLVRRDAN
jgi:hypothetical protein